MKKSLFIKPLAAFALVFLFLGLSNSYAQNYWQQKVQYRIQVRLDDSSHMLHGNEEVVYQNNSPETLQYIWFHLWPNAYKNDKSAFAKQQLLNKKTKFHTAAAKDRGYIDSLAFEVNQQAVKVEFNDEFPDICKIILNSFVYINLLYISFYFQLQIFSLKPRVDYYNNHHLLLIYHIRLDVF
jgi:hypothetical protein